MAFDPTTTFPGTSLEKAWALHQVGVPPIYLNTATMLQPGVRLDLTVAAQVPESPRGSGQVGAWQGLVSSGWGFTGPFDIAWTWDNFTPTDTLRVDTIGVAVRASRYAFIDGNEPFDNIGVPWIFCGMHQSAGSHFYMFGWFDNLTGPSGTLTSIGSVAHPSSGVSGRTRLVRSGTNTFEGFWWDGAAWNSLGSFSPAAFSSSSLSETYVDVAILSNQNGGGANHKFDVTAFDLLSGTVIPAESIPAADQSDDFEDGVLPVSTVPPTPALIGPQRHGVFKSQTVTETGGAILISAATSSRYGETWMWPRVAYPGTDVDLEIDIEKVETFYDTFIGFRLAGDLLSDKRNQALVTIGLLRLSTTFEARLVIDINGVQTILPSAGLPNVVNARHQIRLTQSGNVWKAFLDGSPTEFASFTDTNNVLNNIPLRLVLDHQHISGSADSDKYYDVTVFSGDFNLVPPDVVGPTVVPISPTNGEVGVLVGSNIQIRITDDRDIDLSSVLVRVKRSPAEAFQTAFVGADVTKFKAGFDGPGSTFSQPTIDQLDITIDPTTDFDPGTVVTVEVTATDLTGNPESL